MGCPQARIRGLPRHLTSLRPTADNFSLGLVSRLPGGRPPAVMVEHTAEAGRVWSMTLGDAAVVAGTDPRALAFGYAQRRIWVFWAWWYGAVFFITGAVDGTLSAIVGQDPERGLFMIVMGAAFSVLGWLLTLGLRFRRKLPKPASDIPRVEQALRTNPPAIKTLVIVSVLIVAALITLTPNGRSQELLPITGLVAALLMSITGGFAYSSSLLENSNAIYARWLERR